MTRPITCHSEQSEESRAAHAGTGAAFLRAAWAVFVKDVRCELRSPHAAGAVVLFAVTSAVGVSFALAQWGATGPVSAALLWLVVYFSAMSGLARSFVREEETRTAALLRLAVPPNAVYLGKLVVNLAMLIVIELVAVPLFVLLLGFRPAHWDQLVALLGVGSLGLSIGATTAAAMVSRADTKGALYAVVSFPLLIPVLALAIRGTVGAMTLHSGLPVAQDLRLMLDFSGMVLTASLMLFRFVWED